MSPFINPNGTTSTTHIERVVLGQTPPRYQVRVLAHAKETRLPVATQAAGLLELNRATECRLAAALWVHEGEAWRLVNFNGEYATVTAASTLSQYYAR